MKVLQLFQEYLSNSESWLYNLLNSMRDTEHAIGAIYWSEDSEYFNDHFIFIPNEKPTDLRSFFKDSQNLRTYYRLWTRFYRKFYKQEYRQIKNWCDRNKIDAIHVHFGTTAAHYLPILSKLNMPLVVSFYGYDYAKALHDDTRLLQIYQKVFKVASKVLIEEESGRLKLIKLGCDPSKIAIQRLGVNVNNISFKKTEETKRSRLVQIANFTEKKGQKVIVEMINKHKDELDKKISITFIGNAQSIYAAEVKKLIRIYDIERFFDFIDVIPYHCLHSKLAEFDIFIHPSLHAKDGDCEGGAPTILLDAQAVGLPILSTLHCDIPSYVIQRETGILVQEDDDEQLFSGLQEILNMDNTNLKTMSAAGRKHIEDNFDIKHNAKQLEYLYNEIIKSKFE